jgi:hypothetical protein
MVSHESCNRNYKTHQQTIRCFSAVERSKSTSSLLICYTLILLCINQPFRHFLLASLCRKSGTLCTKWNTIKAMPALKLTQNYENYAHVLCLLSSPKAVHSFTMAALSSDLFLHTQDLVFQFQNFRTTTT